MNKKNSLLKVSFVMLVLLLILACEIILSLAIGSAGYSIREILEATFSPEQSPVKTIVYNLRLSRIFLSLLVGAALSSSGALLQAVMRNPLADPGTIGVSAGAGTAATVVLLLFPSVTNSISLFAFGGAALSCILIYTLAWKDGVDPVRIILSGVAINSVLGGFNSLLQLLNSDSLQGVLAFMNGSLSGKSWHQVRILAFYALSGLILALFCRKSANGLQLGDEMAKNLGFNVNLNRVLLSAVSAFLAASTVSVVGMIGFVGLVVPHISRMLVGSDYKVMLPVSMVLGGVVVLLADTVGRTIVQGMELPVGIIMAVSGGPFFLYMLRKKGRISAN